MAIRSYLGETIRSLFGSRCGDLFRAVRSQMASRLLFGVPDVSPALGKPPPLGRRGDVNHAKVSHAVRGYPGKGGDAYHTMASHAVRVAKEPTQEQSSANSVTAHATRRGVERVAECTTSCFYMCCWSLPASSWFFTCRSTHWSVPPEREVLRRVALA